MTMKKILLLLTISTLLVGCKGCFSTYEQRKQGINAVCKSCTFVMSEHTYYAVDTSKQPNVIYQVQFRNGGFYHNAWEVDELIRIN